jgi:diaminopimelate epimerase
MSQPPGARRWPPRPRVSSRFYKAHGLGNDYLVFERHENRGGAGATWCATPENVARVCDPHRGVGADGIVVVASDGREEASTHMRVTLRMFNPDGSEFERSGNGLRVLASYLSSRDPTLEVVDAQVGGSEVRMRVHGQQSGTFDVSVEMGPAGIGSEAIHADAGLFAGDRAPFTMSGPDNTLLHVVPVSIGNPHLVVLAEPSSVDFSEDRFAPLGRFLSTHPAIPRGTNVQLARASDGRAEAYIWERGVGRTSASGTSSCAVAVALVLVGALDPGDIVVEMPGGRMQVAVDASFDVRLRGPVESIMTGTLEPGVLATFEPGS